MELRNFGFEHKCGIVMPVSSLPSPYGIGGFGKEAYAFVDFLAACGQTVWQVLPLNPTAYADSPYQSPSSAAGNVYFIDPVILTEEGLLREEELLPFVHDTPRVDYGYLFRTREKLLRTAYGRFSPDAEYRAFLDENRDWLEDYALFSALKTANGLRPWNEWKDPGKRYAEAKESASAYEEDIRFRKWTQYEFFRQWKKLKEYAGSRGVMLMGDLPIYVAYDSAEVWKNPELFVLDRELNPVSVAGVPPDGFTPDGQLWGNPLYDWEAMRGDGYRWWTDRIDRSRRLYDILRIDHFRGFAGYYAVPASEKTARNGVWLKGPGYALFEAVRERAPARIVAEDLGLITEDVRELMRRTGYPGMKMLQFAFYDDDSEYLPRNYPDANCVVYTGTHDSETTREWAARLRGKPLERFDRECPRKKGTSRADALIRLAVDSPANLAMIPVWDYLKLGKEARMNRPSVAEGNWTWRINPGYRTDALVERIRTLCEGRLSDR